jgi:TctA family transporter
MDVLTELIGNIGIGLTAATTPANLFYCFAGVFIGMLIGVVPGIGSLAAISLLFPITFYLEPSGALIMLAGIYYGTAYGGSTAAILLNLPGTPSSAVACIDGYPMAKQGRGGIALLLTTTSSFIAGSIGIILMMLFSPAIVRFALGFGPAEYFSLMALGLIAASTMSHGSAIKGIAMVLLGIMFGVIGMDMYTGAQRFTFGVLELSEGISLVALAMGVFGVTEIIASVGTTYVGQVHKVTLRSMIPTRDDVRRSIMPTLRGAGIGSFLGVLPGVGASTASFMSYAVEKRIARDPSRFGKGAVEGVCAPEAANNAADQTSFIPTVTLGIPGSPAMALLIGVLMVHGITPGPQLMTQHPEMFWGLVMSFWIGNVILVLLNIPLIGLWIRLLQVPYHLLYPAVLMFICIGVYSVNNSAFDVWIALMFGVVGYAMRLLGFPMPPLLLGFVLGPLMEENFRRAMILSAGRSETFFQRPVSGALLALSLLILVWAVWSAIRRTNGKAVAAGAEKISCDENTV